MEESLVISGSIVSPYSVQQGVCSFLFQDKEGTRYSLSDPERCLPSYSVALKFTLEISRNRDQVVACRVATRPASSFPLTYAKLRRALTQQASFGSKRLSAVFKGRTRGSYSSARAMVEFLDDEAVRNVALRLFDRHFQPTEYYVVACYLSGPELLQKNQAQLQELQKWLLQKPSLCCFLSSLDREAARGINDMSLSSLQRCCEQLGEKEQLQLAQSEDFSTSLRVYQRWAKEAAWYGSSQHKLLEGGRASDIQYLLRQRLAHRLPSSPPRYCLLKAHHYGDGAVARYLERLTPEQRERRVITEFSYDAVSTPFLLVRSCGSNYYNIVKQLVRSWKLASMASSDSSECQVYCPSLYHAQQFETQTNLPACVYAEGQPPELEEGVGLVVLDRLHLWDSLCVGKLLTSLPAHTPLLVIGDDREMVVCAIFSDLYRSGLFPVLYVSEPPLSLSSDLARLLMRRTQPWQRVYSDLQRMSLEEFFQQGEELKKWIRREKKSVRLFVSQPEQRLQLYQRLRAVVWDCPDSELVTTRFYYNEAVYCRRLRRCLQAAEVRLLYYRRDRQHICQASYSSSATYFPASLSHQQVTNGLLLQDSQTGECYDSPLCYSDGLTPASVELYSRLSSSSHCDMLYVLIQRDTPWKLLYTALLRVTSHNNFCLLYDPDSMEGSVEELLDHIMDQNWRGYSKQGALLSLLQSVSTTPTEEESQPKKQKRRHVSPE